MISAEHWCVAFGCFTQTQKQDNTIQRADDDDVQINEDDDINLVFFYKIIKYVFWYLHLW